MSDTLQLDEAAFSLWQALQSKGAVPLSQLAAELKLDQSRLMAAALEGSAGGFIAIDEQEADELVPNENAADLVRGGLPERQALRLLLDAGGQLATGDFAKAAAGAKIAVNEVFKWGVARGWIEKDKQGVRITEAGRSADAVKTYDVDETALIEANGKPVDVDALPDPHRVRQLLGKRPELAKMKARVRRSLALTPAGEQLIASGGIQRKLERNLLTMDDLRSGAWREITLRAYDVTLPAETVHPAKIHPLRKMIEQTRRAYLEMGFTEVVSPIVESSFWNFDALFQPQDHPARDMQDTFYMDEPSMTDLPKDAALVDRVRRAHEDGGDTGSEGWGYKWSPERARQVVLRTHTTASTIRALARHPNPPLKAFCVGWVCRNETMSYKHLPVFHQVDGIVIDEHASLATLLGTLETFYKKMGFKQVKFKPAFYPYTEPSVDVVVYLESRKKWIEMGGSGIFRPEVTEPLGCKHPVLAWGLGMERLAMIRYGLSDIRELYQGRIEALQEMALAQ
ncbi:phenylalanine--tRNA ligase subunit alpha [Planctomicrobium piriforme]|uniref:phenylalanine--tRNA ligase n=1 Tax=Planctomicrobium piriforme TaxID=1576369 RepID=A0A1I3B690_9PLAN|nr:phenylalanine--tRNA ligase subunit alpha [Planctomicrobium piriforme]SFH57798.1 phenylalanyl-tRNA synthetase alpha chain [Planctomicrobium piriforme]